MRTMRCYTRVAIGLVLMMITGIQLVRAQDRLVGLWSVTEVEVGDDNMTPVARWTEIDSDGTYRSGNGWLQNAVGTWTYDTVHNTFLPKETSGVVDEFGPFLVKLATDTTKTWRRTEEGMEVIVHLQKIDDKPKSTADRITGLWDLTRAEEGGNDVTGRFDPGIATTCLFGGIVFLSNDRPAESGQPATGISTRTGRNSR